MVDDVDDDDVVASCDAYDVMVFAETMAVVVGIAF